MLFLQRADGEIHTRNGVRRCTGDLNPNNVLLQTMRHGQASAGRTVAQEASPMAPRYESLAEGFAAKIADIAPTLKVGAQRPSSIGEGRSFHVAPVRRCSPPIRKMVAALRARPFNFTAVCGSPWLQPPPSYLAPCGPNTAWTWEHRC